MWYPKLMPAKHNQAQGPMHRHSLYLVPSEKPMATVASHLEKSHSAEHRLWMKMSPKSICFRSPTRLLRNTPPNHPITPTLSQILWAKRNKPLPNPRTHFPRDPNQKYVSHLPSLQLPLMQMILTLTLNEPMGNQIVLAHLSHPTLLPSQILPSTRHYPLSVLSHTYTLTHYRASSASPHLRHTPKSEARN